MSAEIQSPPLDVSTRWRLLGTARPTGPAFAGLAETVETHVKPGDTLYFGGSMARPNAAMFEVTRRFWGQQPRFTLVAPAVANQHAPMIVGGLVERVISSIQAMTYPTPSPHPLYVDAARKGEVIFENWSLLTLSLRLMAAALDLPFLPTRSLAGSDMASDLAASGGAATVESPFGDATVQVVAPLFPDVTFVHGLAADEDGNILICPPHYDGIWAAFCARRAVIVTVDHLVSREFMRRYPEHVRIPAHAVSVVCHVPLGGHPNSLPSAAVPELSGYPDDYEFLTSLRKAGKSKEALLEWTQEWILGCSDHKAYLAKLGSTRIHALRGKTAADGWQFEPAELEVSRPLVDATESERHVILAARALRLRFQDTDVSGLLAGLGISSLAAWMASIQMAQQGRHIPLMVESGMYGYIPAPGDPFLFNYRNMSGSSMLSDTFLTLGLLTAGNNNRAFGVLGAAQVDASGNLNTSKLPNMLLTGSGGANDIGSGAKELLVTIPHSRTRLVERVDFITTPGRAVRTVVTPWAVFERANAAEPFTLTRVLSREGLSLEDLIAQALAQCAWTIQSASSVAIEPEPTADEIALARQLDPDGLFLG